MCREQKKMVLILYDLLFYIYYCLFTNTFIFDNLSFYILI